MPLVDITEMDGKLTLIMPKLETDLAHAIEGKGLTNRQKARISACALNALVFLHSLGVMHRDIKPDNIMLNADGDAVLADFSLAKSLHMEEVAPSHEKAR